MGLTRRQVERLVKAIDQGFVENKQGMSYMAQHEVRAELTRIFGFGNWDSQVESMDRLYERTVEQGDSQYPRNGKGQPYYVTCYMAAVRLNIRDYDGNPVCSFVEYHVEENAPLPNRGEANAMAATSVASYALRRAAIGLGDRLGLGLYDKGSTAALVKGTLQLTDPQSPLYVKGEDAPEPPVQGDVEQSRDYLSEAMLCENADEVLVVWRAAKAEYGRIPSPEQQTILQAIADIGQQYRDAETKSPEELAEGAAENALAKGFGN